MFEFTPTPRVKRSPFYKATVRDGVKSFYPYNNMFLPTGYGNPDKEYWRLINGVSMWDVGVQRQVELSGQDASILAQILSPRDLTKLSIGQSKYIAMCDHRGVIINDPILSMLDEKKYWFSIADSKVLFWARAIAAERNLNVDITEPDVSPLAIQGPKSVNVISSLFGDWIKDLKYFYFKETSLNGIPLLLVKSGWSKQGGFELYLMDGSKGDELWEIVKEAGKPWDIGPGYPNTTERIESGLLSWGGDTDDNTNPYEVRLGKYVDLNVPDNVIGIKALRKINKEGPKRHQLGIILDCNEQFKSHGLWYDILSNEKKIGDMTCGIWSNRMEKNIGLCLVSVKIKPGDEVFLSKENKIYKGRMTELPFI